MGLWDFTKSPIPHIERLKAIECDRVSVPLGNIAYALLGVPNLGGG